MPTWVPEPDRLAGARYETPAPTWRPDPTEATVSGLSIEDAATALGVNASTVRRRIKEGKLRAVKVSRPQGYTVRVLLDGE